VPHARTTDRRRHGWWLHLRTTTTNRPHPPEFHIPHAGAANDHLRRSREMDWVSIPAQNQTALSLNMA